MKPEDQQIAIAKALGYKWNDGADHDSYNWWDDPDGREVDRLPDFLNDRNAIQAAFAKLNMHQKYAVAIRLTLKAAASRRHMHRRDLLCPKCVVAILDAEVSDIAEAILRTLNLWVEA